MIKHDVNNIDLSVYEYNLLPEFDFDTLVKYVNEYKEKFPKNYSKKYSHWEEESLWEGGNWWHSDYIVQYQTNDFDRLISSIEKKANYIINDPKALIGVTLEVKESWIIDYKRLSYHKEHKHHPLSFAAICYLDIDQGSDICFGNTKITPETGKLLIFPGSLTHKVSPMTYPNGRRLIMAFNLYPTKLNIDKFNQKIENLNTEKNYQTT